MSFRVLVLVSVAIATAFAFGTPVPVAAGPAVASQPATIDPDVSNAAPAEKTRVIVRLRAPATAARVKDVAERGGGVRVDHRYGVVPAFAAQVTKGQADALAGHPDVRAIESDSRMKAFNNSAQDSFGVTKARAALGVDGNADGSAGYSAADLVAAVIDTGIAANHLDLDEGKVIAFKDFVNARTAAYDDEGHGTHVAATIAGDGDARADQLFKGVAPGAALVGVKVLDAAGSGYESDVIAGIDWVVQNRAAHGIEVINLSLGGSGCSSGGDAVSSAVNNANAAGLIVVVAAGNEGPATCTIGSPAAASGALTVGAMADLGEGGFSQAAFSSRGPTADGRIKPDVSAPGVNITSAAAGTTSGYAAMSGTSMATPFVAGVALLMRDANPGLTPGDVKARVTQTALDWGRGSNNRTAGSRGADIDYGAGRLDAYAAITGASSSTVAVPAHQVVEGSLSAAGATARYPLNVTSTAFPIAGTLITPAITAAGAASPDFDLYILNASDTIVARAETSYRQESVFFRPTATGTYTMVVRSYAGSGDYFVDISAGGTSGTVAAPAPTPTPTPGATAAPTPSATATPAPTSEPTPAPTTEPTPQPTAAPTTQPAPTTEPTPVPTSEPTPEPVADPTPAPDATAPSNPSITSSSHNEGGWSTDSTVEVAFSGAADTDSGVDGFSWSWSPSATTSPDTTVDGPATASGATSAPLPDGAHYFHLRTVDKAGNWSDAVHAGPFGIDRTAPSSRAVSAIAANQTATSFPVSWSAADVTSGIASYDVRYRKAPWNNVFGAHTTWQTKTAAKSATFSGAAGNTYCFSVLGRDKAGNMTAWSAEVCTAVPLDDRSLAASSSWTRNTTLDSRWYAGTYSRSTTTGATLTRTGVQAKRLALVATRCPTCGTVSISWNGTVIKNLSLATTDGTTRRKDVLAITTFASTSPQTGTLVVKLTSSGKTVEIDGLSVGRV